MSYIDRILGRNSAWQINNNAVHTEAPKTKTEDVQEKDNDSKKIEALFKSKDSVSLSLAKSINEQLNVDNTAKILALKEQIANGTYKPDLMKVASSLVNSIEEEIALEKLGNA